VSTSRRFPVVDFTFSWFFGFQPLRRSPHISVYNILVFVCLDFSTTEFPSSLLQRVLHGRMHQKRSSFKVSSFRLRDRISERLVSRLKISTRSNAVSSIAPSLSFKIFQSTGLHLKKNKKQHKILYWISSMFFLVWIIFETHTYPMMTLRVGGSPHLNTVE